MGANLSSRASQDSDAGPISSINVTPFVDVVLVLLVIFMVTAPTYLKDSLNIRLPKVAKGDGKVADTLGVAITRSGQILLNGKLASETALEEEVKSILGVNPRAQAILGADIETRHGDLVRVIEVIKSAGMERFAIQVESTAAP